jgi:hypothetical protein
MSIKAKDLSFIVEDGTKPYASAYSLMLGRKEALKWAKQCAIHTDGRVMVLDSHGNKKFVWQPNYKVKR